MRGYQHLSRDERAQIEILLRGGVAVADGKKRAASLHSVAAELGRSPSTISRELKRNGGKRPTATSSGAQAKDCGAMMLCGAGMLGGAGMLCGAASSSRAYNVDRAQRLAESRPRGRPRQRIRPPTLAEPRGSPAFRYVLTRLEDEHWSPQIIAGRMRVKGFEQRVCAKTIYRFVYAQAKRGGPHRELCGHLYTQRRQRRPRSRAGRRRSRLPSSAQREPAKHRVR